MSRKQKRAERLRERKDYLAKQERAGKLRFRQAGLDQLRRNENLRAVIRQTIRDTDGTPKERLDRATVLITMVACANESGKVAMTKQSMMDFLNDHKETVVEILAEIIGQKAVDQLAAEIEANRI